MIAFAPDGERWVAKERWRRRRGIRRRIAHFHRKARNVLEDWARKVTCKASHGPPPA